MAYVLAGRYELEVPLGRGGSGEVWRGKDLATRRPVAVKLIELTAIGDSGLLAETIGRFRREAMVVSGLRHPNIVAALDAGRIGNELFMVMELAAGVSLATMLDQRAVRGIGLFPVASVLRIAEQASAGLYAAHAAGVVHRDIKPSNLMVTARLGIKIIDFGIARLLDDNSPRLTLPRQTVGTVAYMSPEQARGGDVDGRADLYSLGCVLYELLSGRPPFVAELPEALLMMQVLDEATPLSVVRPGLPAGLPELVSDLMQKDRAARPANAAQVIRRIAAIGSAPGGAGPEHEADRQTIRPGDPPRVPRAQGRAQVTPESGRSTVLAPERLAALASPDTVDIPVSVPAGGTPAWPAAPKHRRRRRRRWRSLVSTLLTAALVVGVGAYVWAREHETLRVTYVSVTVTKQPRGCTGEAMVTATITTNGHGGPIQYEWTGIPGLPPSVEQADARSGSSTLRLSQGWTFHGRGTAQATATFVVLTPRRLAASSALIHDSCPA